MMIDETKLSYQSGTLVEFRLHLGGGPKMCRGFVLNTAVLMGKGTRQVWILDIDTPTPDLEAQWTKKKFIVPENDITALSRRSSSAATHFSVTIRSATLYGTCTANMRLRQSRSWSPFPLLPFNRHKY
jgi:hypothetical protein